MSVQKWTFGFWVFSVLAFHGATTSAQDILQPLPLPITPPAINPIDPVALNAAPAFGDSGPVTKPVVSQESSAAEGTTWIPKLRVVIVTSSVFEERDVVVYTPTPPAVSLASDLGGPNLVVRKTTKRQTLPTQKSVILTCDDVNVEVFSSENGGLTYSFSCKGKAVLRNDSYTVTGDSISGTEGKLTITNAVIKSDQVTMTSEKLELQLPILGVQVGAANASCFSTPMPDPINGANLMKPTPDPINEQKRNNGASRPFSIDLDASPAINKDAAVFPPST